MYVSFDVRGTPVPQGALVRSPSGGLYHRDAKRLDAWRHAIATGARGAIGLSVPLMGPVAVELTFRLPRPKAHFLPANSRRPAPELRAGSPAYHAGAPDVDKLLRAALDALSGVVFADDGQVARVSVVKRYVDATEGPGVAVRVAHLEGPA